MNNNKNGANEQADLILGLESFKLTSPYIVGLLKNYKDELKKQDFTDIEIKDLLVNFQDNLLIHSFNLENKEKDRE